VTERQASARLRVVIVDDEAPARDRLRRLLAREPEIEVTAICMGGGEAIGAIESNPPDLVFLDIQMPEIDGFDVIEAVGVERMPRVIFVTAFEHHAAHAFEVDALDYLLKPFDRARFDKALARARAALRAGGQQPALGEVVRARAAQPLDRLLIRDGDAIHLIKTREIDRIEAAANFVELYVGPRSYLLRQTMTALEARLDPKMFLRVHRETIVQVDRILGMHPSGNGQYRLELEGGVVRPVGRTYLARVEQRLGKL
jgi:two-component system, LytTR family, response regulator